MTTRPKIVLLIIFILFIISCSNKINCDKFNVNIELNDEEVILNIDSDLPDFTNIIVTISRSYSITGKAEKYPIDYFSEKSNIKKWENNQIILLDNSKWLAKLYERIESLKNISEFNFKDIIISDTISVDVIVPARQKNPKFGQNNKNLVGSEVTQENVNFIRKEREIIFPLYKKLKIDEKLNTNLIDNIQSIKKTLKQIEFLKIEISKNEKIVQKKIDDLKKSNPLFEKQDDFESDDEYIIRNTKAKKKIIKMRKKYLSEIREEISELRSKTYKIKNVEVELDKKNYDPNKEEWKIKVKQFGESKVSLEITLDISKNKAQKLYNNWDKVKKTGIIAINFENNIRLVKLILEDPITGYKTERNLPLYHFKLKQNDEFSDVTSVNFSPEYKFFAASSENNTTKIYNLKTGNEVKLFENTGTVNYVDFSNDGKYIAAGCDDCYARIYNLETGNLIKEFGYYCFNEDVGTFEDHKVEYVEFSPYGCFLAFGASKGYIIIKNIETGKNVLEPFMACGEIYIRSIDFSQDGKYVAIAWYNSYCSYVYTSIYNLITGKKLESLNDCYNPKTVNFIGDSLYANYGKTYLSPETFNLNIKIYAEDRLTDFDYYDYKILENKNLLIYEKETGKTINIIRFDNYEFDGYVESVDIDPYGRYIALGNGYNDVYIYLINSF